MTRLCDRILDALNQHHRKANAMDPYYADEQVTLLLGDCLDILPTLPDASVDAVACDPPYELGFMGKAWDASGIAYNVEVWRQCWRVLKPGGHLVAFGGTRTYHRMTVAIEDAGFEIRDSLHWIYGSGFPKGQDIAKSMDRRRDDRAQVLQVTAWLANARDAAGWTTRQMNDLFGFSDKAVHWVTQGLAAAVPTPEQWVRLRAALGFDDVEILPLVEILNGRKGDPGEAWQERPAADHTSRPGVAASWTNGQGWSGSLARGGEAVLSEARQWQGWSTSLKPAHEPIVLARKSTGFNTTVANVLEHGTGALNINGCRTTLNGERPPTGSGDRRGVGTCAQDEWTRTKMSNGGSVTPDAGRWPTNVLLGHGPDCIDGEGCQPGCPVTEMDRQSGTGRTNKPGSRSAGAQHGTYSPIGAQAGSDMPYYGDSGGASRFFPVFRYEAKAPASERPRLADGTAHTTVKPLALMRWLIRLVTPPGGLVLDPFAGSGTTLEAAAVEGFRAVGIERESAHAELCRVRLAKPIAPVLFGDIA